VFKHPTDLILMALEEGDENVKVKTIFKDRDSAHRMLNNLSALVRKLRADNDIRVETIEFSSEEEFKNALRQLKDAGLVSEETK